MAPHSAGGGPDRNAKRPAFAADRAVIAGEPGDLGALPLRGGGGRAVRRRVRVGRVRPGSAGRAADWASGGPAGAEEGRDGEERAEEVALFHKACRSTGWVDRSCPRRQESVDIAKRAPM